MKNLKIYTKNIEDKAREQIDLLLEQEAFKKCKVRIMPDVHAGSGCVIGFTADLGEKVIPNVVGVDIGCGMTWVELGKQDVDLKMLDEIIKEFIPSGMNARQKPLQSIYQLNQLYCFNQLKNIDYLNCSLGSLGGGNHFIEVNKDNEGNLYLIVHSGSRNLGKQVCDIYQQKAIEYCSYDKELKVAQENIIAKLKSENRQNEIQNEIQNLKEQYQGKTKLPKDLCYLEGKERDNYLHDMKFCQLWAKENRKRIIEIICENLCLDIYGFYETIHNYIADDNIVRKGAISCYKGEIALIPMNMKDGCLIVEGKGNKDWNYSAPHGAGRIMSRAEAFRKLNLKDYENTMKDIYTTSVCQETIDEAPMVYKPIDEIINNIKDTAKVLKVIKPIYNYKAKDNNLH